MLPSHSYKTLNVIGSGSFGVVYLVRRPDSRCFAMKKIDIKKKTRSFLEKCQNEVKTMNIVRSPNVVRCYNSFIEGSSLYILLEYLGGKDLGHVLKKHRSRALSLSISRILLWGYQMCLALFKLHQHNVVHCDVKPDNIFLSDDSDAKLGDFGLSRVLHSEDSLLRFRCGTPLYQSPEMCSKLGFNTATDVWSLGCVLYEMMTNHPPFGRHGCGRAELMHAILHDTPRALPTVYPQFLHTLVSRMLSKNFRKRPSIAEACGVFEIGLERCGVCSMSVCELMKLGRVTIGDVIRMNQGDLAAISRIEAQEKIMIAWRWEDLMLHCEEIKKPRHLRKNPLELKLCSSKAWEDGSKSPVSRSCPFPPSTDSLLSSSCLHSVLFYESLHHSRSALVSKDVFIHRILTLYRQHFHWAQGGPLEIEPVLPVYGVVCECEEWKDLIHMESDFERSLSPGFAYMALRKRERERERERERVRPRKSLRRFRYK
ncbi:hypothetical protein ADUPG1_012201 [Aduncisulcus paluster]|uniref:non-specific serine/threonine protein kinase n=1 Tax=Aduncisulcus paluster TaxID=2918883 RepID=A0ABQ5JYN1_9EUKA|nr:hypothetical protein ADUPG1_012201 [Aduncisulcus paluster]